MKKIITLIVLSCLSLLVQAGDAAAGKALYGTCAACHGQNGEGNKMLNSPSLAGQEEWYLARQLANYKTGVRGREKGDTFGIQMMPMAIILADDTAIANVSAYIAAMPPVKAPATVQGDAAKGKALFMTCAACHGQKAEGNETLNAPRLLGQHDWYLVRQLQYFKSGARGANPEDAYGAQMVPMMGVLKNDQDIVDVVSYINTLN